MHASRRPGHIPASSLWFQPTGSVSAGGGLRTLELGGCDRKPASADQSQGTPCNEHVKAARPRVQARWDLGHNEMRLRCMRPPCRATHLFSQRGRSRTPELTSRRRKFLTQSKESEGQAVKLVKSVLGSDCRSEGVARRGNGTTEVTFSRNSRDGSRSDRPSRNQPFCGGVPQPPDPTDRANRPSQPTSEQRAEHHHVQVVALSMY